MQLDLGGILASVLNDLLPGTAPAAGGENPMTDKAFQQLLSRLSDLMGERGVGQLPLDTRTASRPPQLGDGSVPVPVAPAEDTVPSWMSELRALAARVQIQAQAPDRSVPPPNRGVPESDAELADLMAALGPVLQSVFREAEGGGNDDGGGETTGILKREVGDVSGEGPASRLLELVTALPEANSLSPATGREKPAVPVTEAVAVPVAPPSNEGTEMDPSGAEMAPSAAKPEMSLPEKPSAPEREPEASTVKPPEVPAPEKPSGPEVASVRPAEVFQPEAVKDTAPAPDRSFPRSVPAATVARSIDHPQWPDALGERLLWLRDNDVQTAELQIHPRHLGPVAVRIQVQEDQTTIQFASPHAVVREALEAALPRLRELFAGQQLPPAQVEVGQQFSGDQTGSQENRSGDHPPGRQPFREDASAVPEDESPRRSAATGNRLLSLYA